MDQARHYVCKSCSTPVPQGHKFCGRCGESVPPEILTARTMFFSDMQNPAKAKLILIRGEGMDGLSFHLKAEQHVVGRNGQLVFPDDPFISPKHANFFYRDGRLVVRDEGSLNGVYLRVRGTVEISPGDAFLAGEQLFRLDLTPRASDGPEQDGTYFYSSPKHPRLPFERLARGGASHRRQRQPLARALREAAQQRGARRDQNDEHVIAAVDYLLNYAFEQRASDIHLEPRDNDARDPLPHRRHPARHRDGAAHGARRGHLAHQGARAHGHRRAAPPAGRPHQDPARRPRGRAARVEPGHRLRREDRDARVRSERADDRPAATSASAAASASASSAGSPRPIGPDPRHRPDRLGQDHHALLDAPLPRRAPRSTSPPSRTRSRWWTRASARCRCSARSTSRFANALRAILRQDPDIIMVGEIRDAETAQMAVQAALTGHLVFSTRAHARRRRRGHAPRSSSASSASCSRACCAACSRSA